LEDLKQASMYLNRELGIARELRGNLVAIKGDVGRVRFLPSDSPLVHTHPTFSTNLKRDFLKDTANASDNIEAVIDFGGEVTHFNNTGVIPTPSVSPIDPFGFIR
jgi:hypothetical protein